MPWTHFVADLPDLDGLISFIIEQDYGTIYESMSVIDKPIRRIKNVDGAHEMGAGSPTGRADLLLLQIVPTVGETWCYLRENEANYDGHKGVRTSIEGFARIPLYLGGVVVGSNSILKSVLGVGTAAEYTRRAVSEEEVRTIESVDWEGVKANYNAIVKFIRANSDKKKLDGAYVMSSGQKLLNEGYDTVSTF